MKNLNKNLKQKLLRSIKLNDIEIVKIMIEENNIDLNHWKDSTKVIVELLKKNHHKIPELLIKQGVFLDIDYINQSKILITASKNGHVDIVELLLNLKVNPNIQDKYEKTALMFASHNGYKKIVELLLSSEADSNIQNKNGNTSLIFASEKGYLEIVKLLLSLEADLNIQNKHGNTPLIITLEKGYLEIVKLLLSLEADPNIQDKNGNTPLIFASEKGYLEIVELLLSLEADPNIQDKNGNTPLIFASEKGYLEIVELLLGSKADPNIQDKGGNTPLIFASEKSHLETVELLLSSRANPNIQNKNGNTPLLLPSESGNKKIVELLLESKIDPNIQDKNGNTPLLLASQSGNKKIVELLLESKADPNTQDKAGNTPLLLASESGNEKVVELLLESKADPNIKNKNGNTSLIFASYQGHEKTVEILLENGATPHIQNRNGNTPLNLASKNRHHKIIKLLENHKKQDKLNLVKDEVITEEDMFDILNIERCKEYIYDSYNKKLFNEKGINKITGTRFDKFGYDESGFNVNGKNSKNQDKYELLFLAASENGNTKIVESLIKGNINVDIKDENGNTALIAASNYGYKEIVILLLESKANPNIQDKNGTIALILASQEGKEEIVKLLLESEADPNIKDENGNTALIAASNYGYKEIVTLLLKSKANPNIQDKNGTTALILASQEGKEEIVKLLLESKADPNIQGENGNTALIAASNYGYKEIVTLLLESKANPNIQDKNGTTASMYTLKSGHIEIARLLESQVNLNTKIEEKKLSYEEIVKKLEIYIQSKNSKEIEKIITEDFNFNHIKVLGMTPLMAASRRGATEIVELFLRKKVNPNFQDIFGNTALMIAVLYGRKETVEALINNGSNLDMQEENGFTALMVACKEGSKEIITILLEKGANHNIKNDDNNTASEVAKKNGYIEIAKYIDSFKLNLEKNEKIKNVDIINEIEKKINKDCDISKSDSKIELESFNIKKKIFIVDSFFKSYFAKRLDKEEFETFLYDKGHEILNTKDYRSLCHGNRVKKLKAENKIFELRINSGDRLIFTFKEDGIIFLCVDNHNNAIKRGKNTEMNNLVELSARMEDISEIETNDIIQSPTFEYSSLKEIEDAYENNRELYKLTEEQQNIINQKFPICLYGSAGSGKTTMLLKKIEKILRNNGDAQILFLTHNEKLLKYTKGLYETYSGYKLKQINFKDINEFFKQELSIIDLEDNYFSYEKFKEWFDEKSRYNVKLKKLSVLEVFSEIKGIIKGFVGFSGKRNIERENIISKGYYTELKNKYSLLKNDETREEVYSLAINYEKHLKNKGYYDENDLAMRHLREKNEISKYDFLACDEVQDLTELQILSILKTVKDEKNVFLTGDNNQAINLSFFDFGRLETLYRENYNFKKLENSQLSINQRSSEKIVKLAKKIATIREKVLLPNKKIIYKEKTFIKGGNIPILAPLNIAHLSQLENKDITVIVPNAEIKTKIAKNYENTILTTYESKGMERENIVCIGLVDYFKDDVATIVKTIDNGSTEKLSNHYRHFFNLFYVATTRARKKLVFLDDTDNNFFNSLEGSLYKTNNENWLDHFIDIEDMSDDKLLKYAKEFEEKGLYSEALKNYKKMKEINPKYILRSESFINFENKNYEEALKGFDSLEIWNMCLECSEKLKDEEDKIKYRIKVYEKEKKYLPLAKLHHLNSQSQLAFNSFIKYFREDLPELKENNQLFFDILPKIDHKTIEEKDRKFIVDTLSKNPNFYRLALDILVIDGKYKEAEELLELQEERSIEDEFKLFLLKSDGTPWKKGFNELKIKGEKNLYKNFYLNSNMSELNAKILREIDLETLDLFIENGFIDDTKIIDRKFIEQILNEKKENLINYYLKKNKNDYTDIIEKYLEKCIEKNSGAFILQKAKQLLDDPYNFILNFYEKDKIKILINKQLKSEDINLDIFKKSYTNLIEFDSYIKRKSFEGYNSELILNSLDYSSFELEDLMKHQMDHELDEILSRIDKLIPKELFEKLSKENQVRYTKHYTPYTEEKISNKLTVMNLSKEEKPLKINGKYLKNINSMTKVIIDVEDKIKISLGNEERIITLEKLVLGEDKVIFK